MRLPFWRQLLVHLDRRLLGSVDNSQFVTLTSSIDKNPGHNQWIPSDSGSRAGHSSWIVDQPGDTLNRCAHYTATAPENDWNEFWVPGGLLPKGILEAVINNIPMCKYVETKL
uniref:Uncharacterized protein n=1 Tax=Ditylenchus dipsaci TaxID=166011 RepID=A0A915DW84_9BILA